MLKIYNTLTRKREEFKPINTDVVTMYNCGLTVYDFAHIGNLRSFTMADCIRRSLEFLGYNVKQVQNFTDVGHLVSDGDDGEDKMEKGAKKIGKTVWEVAQYYIDAALLDFHKMNFEEPEIRPKATDNIPEQIAMIAHLFDNGYAYDTSSAVYFDTAKFKDYGILTGQNLNDKLTGVRGEVMVDEEKKNPADFRLWQKAIGENANHSMQWDSPWGRGFPGWHLECSAMAQKFLGDTIDIHTGGVDHIPVHHTNEIAQSEGTTHKHFVNYWYHNEFLLVDNKKMSKSLGNFYTLSQLEELGFSPMHLRYFYYTANFRKIQNFSIAGMESAKVAYDKLKKAIENLKPTNVDVEIEDLKANKFYVNFQNAIEDSFNYPVAVAETWGMINSKLDDNTKINLITKFEKALGLELI